MLNGAPHRSMALPQPSGNHKGRGKHKRSTTHPPTPLESEKIHMGAFFSPYTGASPGFGRGGAKNFFFSDLGICMSRSDMDFGGMLPRENFLKRCNLVRFRVYFDQILSLFFSKNAVFYIKNKYFRYTFVMGYFS